MPSWSAPVSTAEAHRRAAGRRRYNSIRTLQARLRAIQAFRKMAEYSWARGAQSRVAVELGVHRSTISRDLAGLPSPPDDARCPLCGAVRLADDAVDVVTQQADDLEAGIKLSLDALRRLPIEETNPGAER
jgi:hypothetical protein